MLFSQKSELNVNITTKLNCKTILIVLFLLVSIMPSFSVGKGLIQSSMMFHMLIQIPMLILAGYLLNNFHSNKNTLSKTFSLWLWIYLSGLFWMLPINLDKALAYPSWDLFKVLSLLITGACLKAVFKSYRGLALFFIGSTVMMLFFIGLYFQTTDVRLCNAYLIESQQAAGLGLIILSFIILSALIKMLTRDDKSSIQS